MKNIIKTKNILIFLLLFKLSVVLAQTTCNNGVGRVLYERLPNQQLQGFDDDVVRDTAPPFRVLEKCQDLCLRDRTAANNLVRACTSFDFQPGSRIASFSGTPEYEESTCFLTREQAAPEGIGNLMLVPNSVHFTEVCLSSSRPERECPSRRYVFERHPRKKLKLPISDIKEMTAANRTDCEDKCLNEFSFVCRSANYDSSMRTCSLSRFTRRTHPELLEDDHNSDYLENTCLNAERRCDGLAVFVKEENKRLGGPFEVDIFNNMTLEECQTMCLRAEKYFCRSVEYDDQTKQCILSEEDSISQKDDISISSSPTHHFYDLVCLDNPRGTDYPDNSVTSHLFSSGRRPDTAFQRYRNSRLGGEFHSEITGRSLSECLDECLRQTSFQCRSAVYSDRFRTCRLSRYNQKDGMRIIYDADYDYYENLMLNVLGHETPAHNRPEADRPDRYPDQRYPPEQHYPDRPPDRYSPDYYQGERHPPGGDGERYPPVGRPDHFPTGVGVGGDRYPPVVGDHYIPDRYPQDKYPQDRYPQDRFPQDRYPQDRYPQDRYPADHFPDRHPSSQPDYDSNDRYPPGRDRYPPRDRPSPGDHHPPPYGPDGHKFGRPYPPIDDNRIDSDYHRGPIKPYPYPPGDRRPYSPDDRRPYSPDDRRPYSPDDRRPYSHDDRTPNIMGGDRRPYLSNDRAPYPYYDYMHYYGREHIKGSGVPDRRIRPSSLYPRYPPEERYYPERYRPDIIHGAKRPEPDTPPAPTSPNRFPIGSDRYPINIFKYGNDRFRGRPGYERAPPYYEQEYDDRYISRPEYDLYDREYERGYGDRRPRPTLIGAGYPPYEPPYRPNEPDRFRPDPYRPDGVRPDGARPDGIRPDGIRPDGIRPDGIRPDGYRPDGYRLDGYRPGVPDGYNAIGGGRPGPQITRCEEVDNFKQIAARHKMRRQFVRRASTVQSLLQCQRECIEARDFVCRSFNYRDSAASSYDERDVPNCELSDRDSRELDVHNPAMFDAGNYDFYERSSGRSDSSDCLDVSQTCNEEGMEFSLRTPEGFLGRIYTYGFYDRCFFRGNGGTVNVLRISGPQGYPDCGTQRYGDTLTNIIVVQFSDNVQTGRDKRYNLTCIFRGPGEAVVTSGYIGAGSGSPIPIEYLPAENTLSSKVRLSILYQNRPTTTIAVGDPLTFRLEAQDGYNHVTDIFASNVVARDPYSGRSIQLIDRYGCPVDPYVFPELDKLREGDTLEARFNAFKIPESNFLVFEATVRSCREGCQPAYCPGPAGRSEPSFGRKRRSINETENVIIPVENINSTNLVILSNKTNEPQEDKNSDNNKISLDEPEQVREMIEVFDSRDEIEQESFARKLIAPVESVCLSLSEYHGLISSVILLMILLFGITIAAGFAYRRYWRVISKNISSERTTPITNSFTASSMRTHERFSEIGHMNNRSRPHHLRGNMSLFGGGLQKTFATGNLARMCQLPVINTIRNNNANNFDDPSEPIYTDPSLFERSRSLRSLSEENGNHEL